MSMKKLMTLMLGAAAGVAIAFWYAPEKTKAVFDKAQKSLKPLADDLTKMVGPENRLPWESKLSSESADIQAKIDETRRRLKEQLEHTLHHNN
jgi:gas vesicle protein